MEPKPSKIKHLEMLQSAISRMASNSFQVKAWCVTLVSALLALSAKDAHYMVIVAYLPVLMFWWLDAYFLRQERLFRELFDQVRTNGKEDADFSMKTLSEEESKVESQYRVAKSKTLGWFYGWLFAAVTITVLILILAPASKANEKANSTSSPTPTSGKSLATP